MGAKCYDLSFRAIKEKDAMIFQGVWVAQVAMLSILSFFSPFQLQIFVVEIERSQGQFQKTNL